ncbi:hypothetical protein LEP1GSC125_1659 [Leptospira mayottensis 200901122]|uniref:Uncharacterized protein n=1 Tax=Leptospira mayottensis 200901122 TaxID=1193010 RepID=A0AA87MK40_9LEPT|nr:hypothetical protein LEP1GSC125_1659 [Leptospira mayottensis 200901122]
MNKWTTSAPNSNINFGLTISICWLRNGAQFNHIFFLFKGLSGFAPHLINEVKYNLDLNSFSENSLLQELNHFNIFLKLFPANAIFSAVATAPGASPIPITEEFADPRFMLIDLLSKKVPNIEHFSQTLIS